jgi:phage gpG-like protein
MAGTEITVDVLQNTATPALVSLSAFQKHEMLDGLGRLVQEQTRRRLRDEKTAPDGTPWKPNRAGTPILFDKGRLTASIDYLVENDERAIVGSGLVYALIHQTGGIIKPKNGKALKFWFVSGGFVEFAVVSQVTIPARPYLGVSADNQVELQMAAMDFLQAALGPDAGGAP